ncbi:MAG: hypothetical protein WCE27_14485, partial [Pseudolabrys sp.]
TVDAFNFVRYVARLTLRCLSCFDFPLRRIPRFFLFFADRQFALFSGHSTISQGWLDCPASIERELGPREGVVAFISALDCGLS